MSSHEHMLTRAVKKAKLKLECGSPQLWPPPQHCYMISYKFQNHFKAKNMFDQCFKRLYNDMTSPNHHFHVPILQPTFLVVPFIWYSMFLFNVKSRNACKYFEYCLK